MPRNKKAAAWTPAESATLAAMRRRGASDAEIGQVLGRSCSSIASRASTLRGSGAADIPDLRQWSAAEIERVIELWDAGESHAAIGAAVGRSAWAIKDRISGLMADGTIAGRAGGVDRDQVRRIPVHDPLLAALHAEHARRSA